MVTYRQKTPNTQTHSKVCRRKTFTCAGQWIEEPIMAVKKITIIDSPEKMRSQSMGHTIIIPQARTKPSVTNNAKAEKTSKTN